VRVDIGDFSINFLYQTIVFRFMGFRLSLRSGLGICKLTDVKLHLAKYAMLSTIKGYYSLIWERNGNLP